MAGTAQSAEQFEVILAETLGDTSEFIEVTADLFANAMDTDVEIEDRCNRLCFHFGIDQLVARKKLLRDRSIAAAESLQKIAADFLDKRPQSELEKVLGAHLSDLLFAHAERESERRGMRRAAA